MRSLYGAIVNYKKRNYGKYRYSISEGIGFG